MNKGEKRAHDWCKEFVVRIRFGDRFTRIENTTGAGIPDTNGCFERNEFWIENKAPTEKVREDTVLFRGQHNFSQDQKNWFLSQLKAGGNCWAFLNTNLRRILVNGWYVENINDMTLAEILKCSSWHCDKHAKDVHHRAAELRQILTQPTPIP